MRNVLCGKIISGLIIRRGQRGPSPRVRRASGLRLQSREKVECTLTHAPTGGTPGWTFRSAGKPEISEMEIDSGTKSTFGPLVVALNTIASRLMAKPLIKIIRRIETAITLSARLIFSPMPVTFRLLS
jgi:hypothetical protein